MGCPNAMGSFFSGRVWEADVDWTVHNSWAMQGWLRLVCVFLYQTKRSLHACWYHHSSQYSPPFKLFRFLNKVYRKKDALLLLWTNSWSCYPVSYRFLFWSTKEEFSPLVYLFPLLYSSSCIVQANFSATWKMFRKSLFFDLIKKS